MAERKYGIKGKKDWRKIHLVVDNHHIIQNSDLSDRLTQDMSMVDELVKPINKKIRHVTADAAYDNNPTYNTLSRKFPSADIVISPQKDAVYNNENHFYRNRNVEEIQCYGRMGWQTRRAYGRRNNSELAIQRYKVDRDIPHLLAALLTEPSSSYVLIQIFLAVIFLFFECISFLNLFIKID